MKEQRHKQRLKTTGLGLLVWESWAPRILSWSEYLMD